jgi:hypothetical protein
MDIEIKAGDACKLVDGTEGIIQEQEDGGLVCLAKEVAPETPSDTRAAPETPGEGTEAPAPEEAPAEQPAA